MTSAEKIQAANLIKNMVPNVAFCIASLAPQFYSVVRCSNCSSEALDVMRGFVVVIYDNMNGDVDSLEESHVSNISKVTFRTFRRSRFEHFEKSRFEHL